MGKKEQIVISIIGGVAEIEYCSDNVEIAIIDFDNIKADGGAPKEELDYWIKQAKINKP